MALTQDAGSVLVEAPISADTQPDLIAQKSTSSFSGSVGRKPGGGGSSGSPVCMNSLYES